MIGWQRLYGARHGDLHGVAAGLNRFLGLELALHDSSYRGGDYYRIPLCGEFEVILQENFVDDEGESAEPDYPGYPLVLYAGGRPVGDLFARFDEVAGMELLRWETYELGL